MFICKVSATASESKSVRIEKCEMDYPYLQETRSHLTNWLSLGGLRVVMYFDQSQEFVSTKAESKTVLVKNKTQSR